MRRGGGAGVVGARGVDEGGENEIGNAFVFEMAIVGLCSILHSRRFSKQAATHQSIKPSRCVRPPFHMFICHQHFPIL